MKKIAQGRWRREQRQKEALVRQREAAERTVEQRIARLTIGGSARERRKLGVL